MVLKLYMLLPIFRIKLADYRISWWALSLSLICCIFILCYKLSHVFFDISAERNELLHLPPFLYKAMAFVYHQMISKYLELITVVKKSIVPPDFRVYFISRVLIHTELKIYIHIVSDLFCHNKRRSTRLFLSVSVIIYIM